MKYTIYVNFRALKYIGEECVTINILKFYKIGKFLQMQKFVYIITIEKKIISVKNNIFNINLTMFFM